MRNTDCASRRPSSTTTGAYLPSLFDTSHTVIWQTLVILSGVLLWLVWASRLGPRRDQAAEQA
jgi:hypothetical protein